MSVVGPVVGPVVIGVVSGIIATDGAGNSVKTPINFTASYEGIGNIITLTWDDNPANANPATSYTITRSGQPDVVITAPTETYLDSRDINPGETIIWFINLTTIDGTSNNTSTSESIPIFLRIDSDGNTRITGDGDRRITAEVA